MKILEQALYYLTSGTIEQGGSWGGNECASFVPSYVHIAETVTWISFCIVIWVVFDLHRKFSNLYSEVNKEVFYAPAVSKSRRIFDSIMAFIHLSLWFQIIYYKINKRSLINLFQPCHVVLLLQGITLMLSDRYACILSVLSLPMVIGTLLAMLFPDTSGLDQFFEVESYWIQHFLILIMPIYLLSRNNFAGARVASFQTICLSGWIVALLHWPGYEFLDVLLNVNVMFMLCPTDAMKSVFSLLPVALFWPSYRSTLTIFFFLVTIILSSGYILISKAFMFFLTAKKEIRKMK